MWTINFESETPKMIHSWIIQFWQKGYLTEKSHFFPRTGIWGFFSFTPPLRGHLMPWSNLRGWHLRNLWRSVGPIVLNWGKKTFWPNSIASIKYLEFCSLMGINMGNSCLCLLCSKNKSKSWILCIWDTYFCRKSIAESETVVICIDSWLKTV